MQCDSRIYSKAISAIFDKRSITRNVPAAVWYHRRPDLPNLNLLEDAKVRQPAHSGHLECVADQLSEFAGMFYLSSFLKLFEAKDGTDGGPGGPGPVSLWYCSSELPGARHTDARMHGPIPDLL